MLLAQRWEPGLSSFLQNGASADRLCGGTPRPADFLCILLVSTFFLFVPIATSN